MIISKHYIISQIFVINILKTNMMNDHKNAFVGKSRLTIRQTWLENPILFCFSNSSFLTIFSENWGMEGNPSEMPQIKLKCSLLEQQAVFSFPTQFVHSRNSSNEMHQCPLRESVLPFLVSLQPQLKIDFTALFKAHYFTYRYQGLLVMDAFFFYQKSNNVIF